MILRKVDEQGYFIEDVLCDSYPTVLEVTVDSEGNEQQTMVRDLTYIETPCQEGLYKPKWIGEKWVEGLTEEEIKALSKPNPLSETDKLWTAVEYILLSGYEVK